jgi:anaerobic magnesium-protoporphyrin IX monomethyl ester cyclase
MMKPNILLVNTPIDLKESGYFRISKGGRITKSIPLGLAYIAAYVHDSGYDVRCLDLDAQRLPPSEVSKHVDSGVDYVGITSHTPSMKNALSICREVKRKSPKTKTILGGPHATNEPEETAFLDDVDIVVIGEGEEVVKNILRGKPLGKIPAIAYKEGGMVFRNPGKGSMHDLDSLPFPAYSMFPYESFSPSEHRDLEPLRDEPFISMISSRGCPFRCSFCSTYHGKNRRRSADNVIEEMYERVRDIDSRKFMFYDDAFNLDRVFVMDLTGKIIKGGPEVLWGCNMRADYIDSEMLNKMKESGCKRVYVGAESGDDKILKTIDKSMTTGKMMNSVRMMQAAGLEVSASFIIGAPRETRETIRETIDFARDLGTDYSQFYIFTPDPGSRVYRRMKELGIIKPFDWMEYRQMVSKAGQMLGERIEQDELVGFLEEAHAFTKKPYPKEISV